MVPFPLLVLVRRMAGPSLYFVNVVHNAPRNADGEDSQVPRRLVPDAAGDVNNQSLVQFDLLVVADHPAPAVDDVVDLVGVLVIVKFRVVDLDMVDLGGGPVLFLDKTADLAAGLSPGLDLGGVTAQEPGGSSHDDLLPDRQPGTC